MPWQQVGRAEPFKIGNHIMIYLHTESEHQNGLQQDKETKSDTPSEIT